jgi:hypothetical protein
VGEFSTPDSALGKTGRGEVCADPDRDPLSRTLPTVLTVFASVVYIPDDPASGAAFPTEGNLDLPGQRLRAIS